MTFNKTAMAAACAWLAILGAATTVHGQCEVEHLFGSDGAAVDYFGYSIAIDGDTAIVGAVWDDASGGPDAGSAYIFVRSGGVWTQQAQLFAADGAESDQFGYSVAIFGDTAVVGADWVNTLAGTHVGSAYVFVRSGGVWTQEAKLFASDGAAFDFFGVSVAISCDTAVVGAPADDTPSGSNAGSAYVFVRSGGVWTQQARLRASDAAAGDWFSGFDVAIAGDMIVVGAYTDNTPGGLDAGSAYVFVRSGDVWTEQAHLFGSAGVANDWFGYSVAISGDTAVVGVPGVYPPDGTHTGSAYVFVRVGTVWMQQAHLLASDGGANDAFGNSVALSGDRAVVGAVLDDTPGGVDAGSAYVFVRSEDVWAEQAHLFASDGAAGDSFGDWVDIAGDTVVLGAFHDDTLGGTDAGSAYVFNLTCPPGDMNCDNFVDLGDVPHFVEALLESGFTGCDISRADVNQDGLINGRDTKQFVDALLAS